MNGKIIAIDALSPKGHITINDFYLNSMGLNVAMFVIGSSIFSKYNKIENRVEFDDSFLKRGRVIHLLFTLCLVLKYLVIAKVKGIDKVVLFSYDIGNVFILSYVSKILGIKLYLFEHNTIPGEHWAKRWLQRLVLKSTVVRFCYTKSALDEFDKLNQSCLFLEHPILENVSFDQLSDTFLDKASQFEYIAFCPSANADVDKIIAFCDLHQNVLFVVKTNLKIKKSNCITKAFFENYNAIMKVSDFIYLPVNLKSRVSGPLFEAMFYGKKIIVELNDFGIFAAGRFNGNVQFSSGEWSVSTRKFDVLSYNNIIKNQLNKTLFE